VQAALGVDTGEPAAASADGEDAKLLIALQHPAAQDRPRHLSQTGQPATEFVRRRTAVAALAYARTGVAVTTPCVAAALAEPGAPDVIYPGRPLPLTSPGRRPG